MDTHVIAAIIAAAATVLTCIITTIFRPREGSTSARKISEKQLLNLLAPLEQLLVYSSYREIDDLLPKIQSLIDASFVYVPSLLWSKFLHLCADPTQKRFDDFSAVVSSLYNHSRKRLGYPHDKGAIIRKYTPFPERYFVLRVIERAIPALFISVMIYASAFLFAKTFPQDAVANTDSETVLLIIAVLAVSLCTPLITYPFRRK